MNKRAMETEFLLKCFGALVELHNEKTEMFEQQNKEVKEEEPKKVTINVNFKSNQLFELFKKIYPEFHKYNPEFIHHIFSVLDSSEEIEIEKSVTEDRSKPIYNSVLRGVKDESSYGQLMKITLLEHINDIVDLILEDSQKEVCRFDEKFLSLVETQRLLVLALLHDIGKALHLMKIYGILKSDGLDEKRGVMFFQKVMQRDDKFQIEILSLLERLESKSTDKKTLERFLKYDEEARIVEHKRLLKEKREDIFR